MLISKEHLSIEGLAKIRSLRTNMNKFTIENKSIGSKRSK
jgi:hypothetical protein